MPQTRRLHRHLRSAAEDNEQDSDTLGAEQQAPIGAASSFLQKHSAIFRPQLKAEMVLSSLSDSTSLLASRIYQ